MFKPSVIGEIVGHKEHRNVKKGPEGLEKVSLTCDISMIVTTPQGRDVFSCVMFVQGEVFPFQDGDIVSLGISEMSQTKYGPRVSCSQRDCFLVKAGKKP